MHKVTKSRTVIFVVTPAMSLANGEPDFMLRQGDKQHRNWGVCEYILHVLDNVTQLNKLGQEENNGEDYRPAER